MNKGRERRSKKERQMAAMSARVTVRSEEEMSNVSNTGIDIERQGNVRDR